MRKNLYIIDGSAYFYRAYYAIRELSTASGLPTNAIYGFTKMLLKVIKEKTPDYLAIAFDAKGPTFRHDAYKAYKAQRPPMPDALSTQLPYIDQMVDAFQIPIFREVGLEADDLMGTLATKGEAAGLDVVIVSGDKDMYQLITAATTVYDATKEKVFTPETIDELFGITPSQIVEMMGLMGDSVDNIPGVTGIGKKTAMNLIQAFGTIENLLNNLDKVKRPKLRESLEREGELARLSRKLAVIKIDCPIECDLDALECKGPDMEKFIPLCRELEFTTLVKEMNPTPKVACTYQILTPETTEAVMAKIAKSGAMSIALVTTPTCAMEASLLGAALSIEEGDSFYLPLPSGDPVPPAFQAILSAEAVATFGHDLKPIIILLNRQGITLRGKLFDTMVASYLLNPDRREHLIETLVLDDLQEQLPILEKNASLAEMSVEQLAEHHCPQTVAILRLAQILPSRLEAESLLSLFTDLEMPLVPVLAGIEQNGVRIDIPLLNQMSEEMKEKLGVLTKTIHELAGGSFNINSPKQLAEILFDKLGLKPIKKTKTGFSTNEEVLTKLAIEHPLPAEILNSRSLSKLKSTYVDALPRLVHSETGRVHTQLNQTVTATGRLSSKAPNLQNIPIRGEMGQRIRGAFIPAPGQRLLSADYNQIELRILAHLSDDAQLIAAFQSGEDIHRQTAVEIFGLAKEDITTEMRRVAKSVNFGIIYGISAFGLSNNLGVSRKEAQRYIDLYFEHYPGVKRFADRTLEEATEKGYVTTLLNRRRKIAELNSRNRFTQGVGERMALNTPVQGSAADIIKLAMIAVWQWMAEEGLKSTMTLQVHDELLFDVCEEEVSIMKEKVSSLMEGVVSLKVPLTVDVGIGSNWNEAH